MRPNDALRARAAAFVLASVLLAGHADARGLLQSPNEGRVLAARASGVGQVERVRD